MPFGFFRRRGDALQRAPLVGCSRPSEPNASLDEWRSQLTEVGVIVGAVTKFRLRLEFASWIERMKTPESHVLAIRSSQRRAGREVTEHFAIEDDGSFAVDTVLMTAKAPVGLPLAAGF